VSLAEDIAKLRDVASRGADARTNLVLLGLLNLVEGIGEAQADLALQLVRHMAQQHDPRQRP
jgi:hypothetical protein